CTSALRAHQVSIGAVSANCASHRCAGALRALAEDGLESFCHMRVAQECMEWRRSARMKHQEPLSSARRADSSRTLRTFIVHHARCAGKVARRAAAKSI
ncbi:hypothetical protein A2U01_0044067, partial [Trifolium medium]|nr:hypothetical protein [Trifolium medium]